MSWFNTNWQLSTIQTCTPSQVEWGAESEKGKIQGLR